MCVTDATPRIKLSDPYKELKQISYSHYRLAIERAFVITSHVKDIDLSVAAKIERSVVGLVLELINETKQ